MRYLLLFAIFIFNAPAIAQTIEADKSAVRVMAYYGVGEEDTPATNVTLSQFKAHLNELDKGGYNVLALPDVIAAYDKNAPLPDKAIVITFDGSEKSILTQAVPLLRKYQFPFTVFLSPKRIKENNPRYLSLKDIKRLQKLQLVTFGLHPENYSAQEFFDTAIIRSNLNNAVSFYREIIGSQPAYFAFPHGLYSKNTLNVVKNYGFKALFGEQSAVAYNNKDSAIWPRFLMTENYADQNRFRMTANALPLPVTEVTPHPSVIPTQNPAIGFTVPANLNTENLSCFATGQGKPAIERLGSRIEIRLKHAINEPRFRVNCTLPVKNEDGEPQKRWRWFGLLLQAKETL